MSTNDFVYQLRAQAIGDEDVGHTVSVSTSLERAMADARDRNSARTLCWSTEPNDHMTWHAEEGGDSGNRWVITKTPLLS